MNDLTGAVTSSSTLAETGAACIARARALIPLLRASAAQIDAANELPLEVVDAMHQAQMFRLLIPRRFGGLEIRPVDFVQCVEAIAEGDASAAWCMNQASGCSMSAAYVAPEVAMEVWGHPRDVLAWGQGPGAKAIRTEGGWRVTGSWTFASGSRHATWLGAHCPSFEADGTTPIRQEDGRPWERTMLLRREQARIEDVWDVLGLRGTGSDTYSVTDLFIDDAHTLTREHAPERRESGALFTFQAMHIYAAGFASVALGVTRSMIDAVIDLAKTKSQAWTSDSLRGNHAVQYLIGNADAAWHAARAALHAALRHAWEEATTTGALSLESRVRIRQASSYAIHTARDQAHVMYHEAGSTAIFANQPFERLLRNINSVSQQVQGRRAHLETVGTYLLGGAPSERWL